MDGTSLDIKQDNLEKLKKAFPELFPEFLTEGKIDIERLKALLGEDFFISGERYVLNWAGKSDALRVLQVPTTATLKPQPEESVNFDNTENVFIEGENLEVLKVLQKSYYGKIKCIIIDPPYNTGNDSFIYPDSFKENRADYQKRIGEKDEEGYLMKEGFFRKNSRDSGHYHSAWLSMMYPRLFLAKNLLRDDGVIFVHIDDNEVHNLRLIMNEIFGEENFFTQIIVRSNSRGQTYKQIAKTHEYILVYTRNPDSELNELEKDDSNNDLNLKDKIGNYNIRELRNRNPKFGKHNRPNLFYAIYLSPNQRDKDGFCPVSLTKCEIFCKEVVPLNSEKKESCWRWGKTRCELNISVDTMQSNLVAKMKNDGSFGIYEKYRKSTYKPKSIWDDNRFLTETGTIQLREIGLENIFDFPKPVELEKQILNLSIEDDDIVLDFFGGSATTAQAILELNKKDGGNRKFILVQLPEPCDENSEAYKAGYKTIADIGRERIRRVIRKIAKGRSQQAAEKAKELPFEDNKSAIRNPKSEIDLGFKSFKLSPSNFKIWRGNEINGENLEQQLEVFTNPVRDGSRQENILYELMLKAGYLLTDKIQKLKIETGELIIIDEELILNLDAKDMDLAVSRTLSVINSQSAIKKVITLDILFKGNDQLKTNTVLQMRDAGVEFKTI